MKAPSIILASTSPRRKELLSAAGYSFTVFGSSATEISAEHLTAVESARINAVKKAEAVACRFPECLVIGADTLVFVDNHVLGKPSSLQDAEQMLLRLQGRSHGVVTGVSMICQTLGFRKVFDEVTVVTFKPLVLEEIRHYFTLMNPLDKAGGYAIQEHGDRIVLATQGSYTNVVGLPMERLKTELDQFLAPFEHR